ncbi:MAG: sodium:solute symporter [Cyclobacteriaceae bacterium]|nr:sodium:solute symporter [Cyclobacteriaceae bacterium]
MNNIDLLVLGSTLLFIVAYGVWKTRGKQDMQGYLLGDNSLKWGTIGLSVMATQASAITFISTPGQAYESGMGFVQNYFGLPIALLIVSVVFIPIYYKLKVYTAYEYLEKRFDVRVRILGAMLFLIQRGMAAGITIYAPAIILSTILGWNLTLTIVLTGSLVIIYTVSGGTRAVSITQKQQMAVIMGGMFVAFGMVVYYLSDFIGFGDAVDVATALQKTQAVDFDFSFEKRYTFWSGITGGLFLSLSYFGTDQSQVQRYLGGKNIAESRMGLMFNAIFKIPMQFFILFVGVMVYVFYIFYTPPVHFKEVSLEMVRESDRAQELVAFEGAYAQLLEERKSLSLAYATADESEKEQLRMDLLATDRRSEEVRQSVKELIATVDPMIETKDSDYVFLSFILGYLPHGLIGLLIAVILSAAMSSTSGELNALASTTSVDFYQRHVRRAATDDHYVKMSRVLTMIWGFIAISFALLAKNSENLIEAVNIIGSLFYGTILGIFLVAFFLRRVGASAVFYAAIFAELFVLGCHFLTRAGYIELGYLWYNAIGCVLTLVLSWLLSFLGTTKKPG